MTCAGLKGRCFLELKSVLLKVSYIKKWLKFAYLESKVPHLKFRVMRDRVYMSEPLANLQSNQFTDTKVCGLNRNIGIIPIYGDNPHICGFRSGVCLH